MNPTPDFLNDLMAKNEAEQKRTAMNILSAMDSKQSEQVKSILSDQEKIKQILASPQAQQLMKKLKGNNNGQHK
ncbi:MAG: hypothetical protein MJ120_00715 [Clostridia bacterium]|nr:hypothetical protein [Clostridia bacterium]